MVVLKPTNKCSVRGDQTLPIVIWDEPYLSPQLIPRRQGWCSGINHGDRLPSTPQTRRLDPKGRIVTESGSLYDTSSPSYHDCTVPSVTWTIYGMRHGRSSTVGLTGFLTGELPCRFRGRTSTMGHPYPTMGIWYR